MKLFFKVMISWVLLMMCGGLTFAGNTDNIQSDTLDKWNTISNEHLDTINDDDDYFTSDNTWETWLQSLIIVVAKDIKNIVFVLVTVIAVIMVIKLIFGAKSEEEANKLKNGILWASIGIMVMQIAFSVTNIMFNKDINGGLSDKVKEWILQPFIELLYFIAAFAFIIVAILAFYRMVTANGNEDATKKGKMSIFYAILWFIIIKLANTVVTNTLNISSTTDPLLNQWINEDISKNVDLVIEIIKWVNGFIAVVVILMVIYAGFLVLVSWGTDENLKKAKNILLYIFIGIIILISSYLILTFFLDAQLPTK